MATSSSSSSFSPPTLSRFFIFNPKFGPREDNDHEKILFFHPNHFTLDAQMKDVGLSEALTNITKYVPLPPETRLHHTLKARKTDLCPIRRTFSRDAPCEVMHTKKMRWIFHNPEPGYWMVIVCVPTSVIGGLWVA